MKKLEADEGKVWMMNGRILGRMTYVPDGFCQRYMVQVPAQEAEDVVQVKRKKFLDALTTAHKA